MKYCILLISMALGACSVLPPAFEDARIKDVNYAQVVADVESYTNEMVRWGGVIISLENIEKQSALQVIFYPLDYYGRPDIDSSSEGYFIIKSPEHLDPEQFTVGRELVAVGTIAGSAQPELSSGSTDLPLMKATGIYLWPVMYRENYYIHCPHCYYQQLFW